LQGVAFCAINSIDLPLACDRNPKAACGCSILRRQNF
jgi:hypothetical protein